MRTQFTGGRWCYEQPCVRRENTHVNHFQGLNCTSISANGPPFWGSLWRDECSLTRQSPIAINRTQSVYSSFSPIIFLNYDILASSGKIINDGHSLKVKMEFPRPPVIFGGSLPSAYQLIQYHFHWGSDSKRGSEHVIDGVKYPLEMHLVHQRTDLVKNPKLALEIPNSLAVLAVLFEVSDFDNPILENVISNLRNVNKAGSEVSFDPLYPLVYLLPLDKESFYRYSGSLTTPECNEAVVWTVFMQPLPVSENQLKELRTLLTPSDKPLVDNYRPLHPLGGRIIYRHGPPTLADMCRINPGQCSLLKRLATARLLANRAYLETLFLGD